LTRGEKEGQGRKKKSREATGGLRERAQPGKKARGETGGLHHIAKHGQPFVVQKHPPMKLDRRRKRDGYDDGGD